MQTASWSIISTLSAFSVPHTRVSPLASCAAIALAEKYNKDVSFCFDRKEVKDHGEGGLFVGKQPAKGEKVVIIEDVMTSGKALKEVYPKLKDAADVDITGMIITVDRMGKGSRYRAFRRSAGL